MEPYSLEDSTSSDSEDNGSRMLSIITATSLPYVLKQKKPQRTHPFNGQDYVEFLMDGHDQTIVDMLRMNVDTFQSLAHVLVEGGFLNMEKMRLSVEESLAMFLYVIGNHSHQRPVADRFQHSTETVSHHVKRVMRALCQLATIIIHPPNYNFVDNKIYNNKTLFPWFQVINCKIPPDV